jgi:hypothetical protein
MSSKKQLLELIKSLEEKFDPNNLPGYTVEQTQITSVDFDKQESEHEFVVSTLSLEFFFIHCTYNYHADIWSLNYVQEAMTVASTDYKFVQKPTLENEN